MAEKVELEKTAAFEPERYARTELPSGRIVRVYIDNAESIGLRFTNKDGEETRCLLSPEAGDALVQSIATLKAGGGVSLQGHRQWVALRHTLEVCEADQ